MKNQKEAVVSVRLITDKAEEIATNKKDKLLEFARKCYSENLEKTIEAIVTQIKYETPENNLFEAMSWYAKQYQIPIYTVIEKYKHGK